MKQLPGTGFRDMRVPIGVLIVSLLFAFRTPAWAQEVVVADFAQAKQEIPSGWKLAVKEGEADIALVDDSHGQVLRLRSNSSSFSLNKEIEIDLKKTPYLEWQWKVTELPEGGDFRRSDRNDQAAQLLVVFYWSYLKKEVITYIWDSTAPKATVGQDPSATYVPLLTIHALVVESGDADKGRWVTETRNVVEDYRRLFGSKPRKVQAIRIQINSQNTQSQAESYWRSVRFKARP